MAENVPEHICGLLVLSSNLIDSLGSSTKANVAKITRSGRRADFPRRRYLKKDMHIKHFVCSWTRVRLCSSRPFRLGPWRQRHTTELR